MALSIKKRGLLVAFVVSAITLALCSWTWAQPIPGFRERLNSFTGNGYILNINLPGPAYYAAKNYINEFGLGWLPLPVAILIIHDRHNVRGDLGQITGNGDYILINVLLLLKETPASNHFTILLVKTFNSNQAAVDYAVSKGVIDDSSVASEMKITLNTKRDEDGTKVKSKFELLDPEDTITFQTKWVEPEPTHFPTSLLTPGYFVEISPYLLRFAFAPERLFEVAQQRTIYEPSVSDIFLKLDINLSGPLGAIFNDLTEADVNRFRFVHQIQTLDEIIPSE